MKRAIQNNDDEDVLRQSHSFTECILHNLLQKKLKLVCIISTLALAVIAVASMLDLLAVSASASFSDLPMLQPPPNTHAAPINTALVVSFATAIDPATVSTRTIAVHSAYQGLLTGLYTVDDTQVRITPTRPFFPGELVQVVVTTYTQAFSGAALVTPAVWQFRTAAGAGSGIFIERASGLDSTWSEDINLGDLDGDGDLDIFLGHRDEASSVWFNDGAGYFSTNGIDFGTAYLIDLSLGDLDGDGDLDMILAGIQDNSLWWNDGHGQFSYGGALFSGSPLIRKVVLGDLDGDGDLDAVTVTSCDPFDPDQSCDYAVNRVWWNDGVGGLISSTQSLGHGTSADLSLGDLDDDGDLDAMVVSAVQGNAVWMNLGGGNFTSTQLLDGLSAVSVAFGDLDGDDDLDAFVASQSLVSSTVWLNVGSGVLAPGQHLGHLGPAVLGDLDGDGDLDAFSANNGADKVWLNQGDATFVFSGQNLGAATSSGVALGDLDGDGDLDAVTSGYNTQHGLWMNQSMIWLPIVSK